jgi:gas vesicle protein
MNTTAKVLIGFLAGTVVGTITGILVAPDRGSKTRRRIREESKHLKDDFAGVVTNTFNTLTGRRIKEGGRNGHRRRSQE